MTKFKSGDWVYVYGPILFGGDYVGSAVSKTKCKVELVNRDDGGAIYLVLEDDKGSLLGVANPKQCRRIKAFS